MWSAPTTATLRSTRLRASAPRWAFVTACGAVAVGSLGDLARPAARSEAKSALAAPAPTPTGFAESFAIAFLGGRPADELRRRFGFAGEGIGAPEAVRWTAAVDVDRRGAVEVVTVAVRTGRTETNLAVPVSRDDAGRLSVLRSPAIVGPPAVDADAVERPELEVEDRGLRRVARRAVRHFLAGDRDALAADLATGAVVSPPVEPLRLQGVGAITRAGDRRIAVALVALDTARRRLHLRYELDVARLGDRWLVSRIHTDPTTKEVTP
jgi:hypothetical protein